MSRISAAVATGKVAWMSAGLLSSGSAASAMRTPSSSGRFAAAPIQSFIVAKARTRLSPNASLDQSARGQLLARESVPDDRDRALEAVMRDELVDGVAAHPDGAAVAVGVAQHGVGRDDAFQSAVVGHRDHRASNAASASTSQLAIRITAAGGRRHREQPRSDDRRVTRHRRRTARRRRMKPHSATGPIVRDSTVWWSNATPPITVAACIKEQIAGAIETCSPLRRGPQAAVKVLIPAAPMRQAKTSNAISIAPLTSRTSLFVIPAKHSQFCDVIYREFCTCQVLTDVQS